MTDPCTDCGRPEIEHFIAPDLDGSCCPAPKLEPDPPTFRTVTVSAKEYARGAAIRRYLTERGATIVPTRIGR